LIGTCSREQNACKEGSNHPCTIKQKEAGVHNSTTRRGRRTFREKKTECVPKRVLGDKEERERKTDYLEIWTRIKKSKGKTRIRFSATKGKEESTETGCDIKGKPEVRKDLHNETVERDNDQEKRGSGGQTFGG